MHETTLDIIKISSGILGGGLAGAILNNLAAKRKARIQPIAKRVKISNIFIPSNLVDPHITKITFSGTTSQNYHFDNLTIAQIEIINSGNKDYESFEFGLSFEDGVSVINYSGKGIDRHHTISSEPNVDFSNPSQIIDLTLKPFNRKDKYEITLFLTNENLDEVGEIKFSSGLPVKFLDLDTFRKTFIEVLKESLSIVSASIVGVTLQK